MHSLFQWILLFVFITSGTVYGQPTNPPHKTHNLSQERLKSKFKLSKTKYINRIDLSRIDTNAIYIQQQQHDSTYVFLRFFRDAYFESGSYENPPTDEEAEDLNYGSWRCYTMDKQSGLLILEIPMPFLMSSRWMYCVGELSTDSIIVKGSHGKYPSPHSAPSPFFRAYYKRHVDFKNRVYAWMPATKEDLYMIDEVKSDKSK